MGNLFLIILIIFNCIGCSLLKSKPKPVKSVAVPVSAVLDRFLSSSQVLNQQKLMEGGRILVVPFTPGVNAAAGEELDRVSLVIVQGMTEVLSQANSPFTILDAGNADTADFILQGRIVKMKEAGRLKKWTLGKDKKYLAVEGKMIAANSGEIVFHFEDAKASQGKKQPLRDLGLLIGQDIGKFLISFAAH